MNAEPDVNNSPEFEHKRLTLAVIISFLWIILGVLGAVYATPFYDLSIYFISLTGFVGSYIISETKRPAVSSTIFKKGRSSKREIVIYAVTGLWLILGIFGVITKIDLLEAAAYFSALTPYISTYLLGVAYTPELPKSVREQMLNNSIYNPYGNGGQVINVVSDKKDEIDP